MVLSAHSAPLDLITQTKSSIEICDRASKFPLAIAGKCNQRASFSTDF